MLKIEPYHKVPQRLSHHTSLDGLIGILTDNIGKLTFRAVSNKYKNDATEIEMGKYIFEKAKTFALPQSFLQKYNGFEDSASISFTEGEISSHMISEYGRFRLDLDLRNYVNKGIIFGNLVECEYVAKADLEEYANEYCALIHKESEDLLKAKNQPLLAQFSAILSHSFSSLDLMAKVFAIKEGKWKIEKEWRIVIPLKESEKNVQWTKSNKPYKNLTFPIDALSGITIFSTRADILRSIYFWLKIRRLLKRQDIHAYVKIQFEKY